jgi:ElaB/YqjD/DUF883 family membrane-anchored ribosome-binding protein
LLAWDYCNAFNKFCQETSFVDVHTFIKGEFEMSQNNPGGSQGQGNRPTGGAGTGATDAGTTASSGAGQNLTPSQRQGGATGPGGQGTATALAQEYGQKIADAANTAKDYVSDKVSVVGDKLKDIQNVDFNEVATQAKDYARQNPGQAILVSAAAGFVLGLLLRGRRR